MTARTLAYIGNFEPPHSTENHVKVALERLGWTVHPLQENRTRWADVPEQVSALDAKAVMWTRTWSLDNEAQNAMLEHLQAMAIPTIGYHLDRWIGLTREHLIHSEAFFRCELVITADGGHEPEFAAAGVNHLWMPPAVEEGECYRTPEWDPVYDYDVGFVGTWQNYGHPEWGQHRRGLIEWLMETYPKRFRPYCCGIRGQELANLYGQVRVIVGDSCLANGATRYWSDRIPETLGRGGFLIHPHVHGIEEHFIPGEHLVTYPLGDLDALRTLIDYYLTPNGRVEAVRIAKAGQAHVRAKHTYTQRMQAVSDLIDTHASLKTKVGRIRVQRRGVSASFDLRPDDGVTVHEVWRDNVYGFEREDVAGRVVLDIGANVGAFALWAAAAGAAHVWAYEPDPANREALAANLTLNGISTVTVVGEAVSDRTGEAFMGGSNAHAHLIDAPRALTDEAPVVVVRHIDEVLTRAGQNLVVKMDCEGCEHEALTAVADGHLRRIDRLAFEYHGGPFEDSWKARPGAFGRLLELLAEHGTVTTLGKPSAGLVDVKWTRYGA